MAVKKVSNLWILLTVMMAFGCGDGKSSKDDAGLDMTETAVKVSLHRTRAALRRDLKEWLE